MKRALTLLALGAGVGAAADHVATELRKPGSEQFLWLRRQVNGTVDPWLLDHHLVGGAKAEIGTLEHVGRRSGVAHLTPVHPTIRDDTVLVPAPLGVGSQWAQNVLSAGTARLQLHETLYELDRPELIHVGETGFFPAAVAAPFDRLGARYVRMHVVASAPGAFATHVPAAGESLGLPIEGTHGIPVEPRMVERKGAPA